MKLNRSISAIIKSVAASASILSASALFASTNDSGIGAYKSVSGVSGTLKAIGSDSMNNEMALWAEAFRKFYPGIKIEVEGKGSATAPPALIEGTAQLGPMSRPMKTEEIDSFKKKFGYEPTALRTSLDVLAVYVHRDNPIKSLTMAQVDAVFSKTRKGGAAKDVVTWGDLGLTGEWAQKPIQLYGRNSASGTYGYFKDHALAKGDFKDSVKEQPGSASVVQGITNDKYAIGYSGIGYLTPGVRAVPLSQKDGKAVEAKMENAYSGTYPLSRFLLVYVNKSPNQPLDPLRKEFLKFILSKEGQQDVVKEGYIPLTPKMAQEEAVKFKLN